MKQSNRNIRFVAFMALAVVLASCGRDNNDPGIQYAPEMYESIPYEPYKQVRDSMTPFKNGLTMQIPPDGTIPRGGSAAFAFAEGDSVKASAAVRALKNPVPYSEGMMEEAKVLYERFCGICHGPKGKGNGKVAEHDAINPSPYDGAKLKDYAPGQVYHTIMHGQGVMGNYAGQLDEMERWKVVHYVQMLQGKDPANPNASGDAAAPAPEFNAEAIDIEAVNVGDVFQLNHIFFKVGGAQLTDESKAELEQIVAFMNANASIKVEVDGHTDNTGNAEKNHALSQKRADAVVDYIKSHGIAADRLAGMGYGSEKPVAPNDTPENMQRNRRTELKITEK